MKRMKKKRTKCATACASGFFNDSTYCFINAHYPIATIQAVLNRRFDSAQEEYNSGAMRHDS
jgi:hypothetical protein